MFIPALLLYYPCSYYSIKIPICEQMFDKWAFPFILFSVVQLIIINTLVGSFHGYGLCICDPVAVGL